MSDRRYWLVKSEPDCFSFDDLLKAPKQTTYWSGVRNYQARNFMRDQMQAGDGVLFHHSSAEPSGIVGVAEVVKEAYPDFTALDPKDDHYDPKSTKDNPIWYMVEIKAVEKFSNFLSLNDLRHIRALEKMELLKRGSRLSVQPVSVAEWNAILAAGKEDGTASKKTPKPAAGRVSGGTTQGTAGRMAGKTAKPAGKQARKRV